MGTPLHCAAKGGHVKIVAYLLMEKANIDLTTADNKQPIDVSTNDKVTYLLCEYRKNAVKKVKAPVFVPPKPPRIKGPLFKVSSIFGRKSRSYFVLDPEKLTLTEYKKCLVPEELSVCPLEKMKDVKKLTSSSGAKYYYFEFYCGMRHQLCSKSERIVNLWVKYLNSAIIYTSFLNSLKRVIESPETSESLKALNRKLLESMLKTSQEEIELEEAVPSQYRGRGGCIKSEEDKKVFSLTKEVGFSSFKLLEKIGSGAFGSVFKVLYNPTGTVYAMKAISKRYLFRTNQQKYALSEAQMLKIVGHPFTIKLHFAFQTPRYLYFILDYCSCGDMAMHIAKKVVFKESEARFYIAELVLAIEYLHSLDIVYRDLKPENLLVGTLCSECRL